MTWLHVVALYIPLWYYYIMKETSLIWETIQSLHNFTVIYKVELRTLSMDCKLSVSSVTWELSTGVSEDASTVQLTTLVDLLCDGMVASACFPLWKHIGHKIYNHKDMIKHSLFNTSIHKPLPFCWKYCIVESTHKWYLHEQSPLNQIPCDETKDFHICYSDISWLQNN